MRRSLSSKQSVADKALWIAAMQAQGYPAYTMSAGWIGYSDDKVRQLCCERLQQVLLTSK
jgi:L-fuconate dehydratase